MRGFCMETAIGVFPSREQAEEALKSLFEHGVPEESVVYLTRSENDATSIGKQFGTSAGLLANGTAEGCDGIAATSLLTIPRIGPVFAVGPDSATLLGVAEANGGSASAENIGKAGDSTPMKVGAGSLEDLKLFNRVLNERYSVIIVRTEFPEIAATSCEILNRLSLRMKKSSTSISMVTIREVNGPVVAYVAGRIALAEGTLLLRDMVQDFLRRGNDRIVLDLNDVDFIDSAGLGELVRSHASVRAHGGQLKLVNPSANVWDLLKITKLDQVFDIPPDEATALASFTKSSAASPG
jgi:anti-sigma B factor antagonist